MRLHTFLLFALFAIVAQSATIPENIITQSEKKVDTVSAEIPAEEQIDQENTINDVDNKLRLKPADIPVKVVVENANPALKLSAENSEAEEIVRPPIDLNNPGVPQRQEHDSQSPEAETTEVSLVEIYKKNINEAQNILKQGFQDVNNGIQHLFEKKDQVDVIQHSIESFKKTFVNQINKINGTVLSYLSNENGASPAEQQTKAQIEHLKTGLNTLKSEFNKGVNTLADGVVAFSSLKADGQDSSAATGWTGFVNNLQGYLMGAFPAWPGSNTEAPPAEAQADTEDTGSTTPSSSWFPWPNPFAGGSQNNNQQTGGFGSGNGPVVQLINTIAQAFQPGQNQPTDPLNPDPVTEDNSSTQGESQNKPEGEKPSEPAAADQAEKTTLGPIREILQNNPISQGIASVVQNLQNINRPKEPEKEKEEEAASDENKIKLGFPYPPRPHPPVPGDNNNVASGLEQSEQPNVPKEILPQVQEPLKEEEKEHKTEVVANKTE